MGQTLPRWAASLVSLSIVAHGFVACSDGDDSTATVPEQHAALDATTGDALGALDEPEGAADAGPGALPDAGTTPSQPAVDGGTVDVGSADSSRDADATLGTDTGRDGGADADATLDADAGRDGKADAGDGPTSPDALEAGDATPEACGGDACSGDANLDGDAPAEAVGDANTDAGDSGVPTTTLGLLKTALGAGCASCAQTSGCVGAAQTCDSLGTIADSGSGVGETVGQLCLDTLSCLASTRCPNGIVDVCYCADTPLGSHCTTNGPCVAAEQKGLETTDDTEIYNRFYDPSVGGGVANNIAQCLLDNCTTCFP